MTGSSFLPLDSGHDTGTASLEDTPIIGPRWTKLPALTLGFIGLQALWSVEMSYGALTSELQFHAACSSNFVSFAVFAISGDIKITHGHCVRRGAIVRSYRSTSRWYRRHSHHRTTSALKLFNTGVLADNSTSRFGRRRPFMIGGAIVTAIATILFGFTRPVAGVFSEEGSELVRAQLQLVAVVLPRIQYNSLAIWLAVFAIYVMDFSINAGACYVNPLYAPSAEVSLCNMQSRLLIGLWSLTCYRLVCKPPATHGLPLCLALAVLLVSSC